MKKIALVTGGSRGIGAGIALALVHDGFTVVITGRRPEAEVDSFLSELRRVQTDCIYIRADVSDHDSRSRLVGTLKEKFHRLDVLVNNAGIAPRMRADVLEEDEESYDEVLGTNLKGPHFLTQQIANWMIQQPASKEHRAIINISSISATVASVNRASYCISKAGVSMATRLWAVRLAEFGIGVYEIRPGIVATDMTKGVQQKYDNLIESGLLLEKRWGLPEDVGKAVSVLARGDLAYASGAVLVLDGGLTIGRL
jgi:NAD(P)-dependent dehydrogenase (short-subunit alcohol dehydrogenase family)